MSPISDEHDKQDQRYEPDHSGMYELEFPAPQLSSSDGRGPVMIHALEGFSDAGHAIRLSAQHLKNTLDTELVASFAIDELLDYRSRRPLMTFKTDHFTNYEEPELSLYALHDSVGTPFLLLAGMEPDLRWERFITAVRLLAERLDVRQTIGLGTIPMAVPHTRPITLTAHANNKELIADHTPWVGEVQVPGSVSNLLEYRMAQHGHDVVGFTVHVPHYLAQTDYPAAAEALLVPRWPSPARCSCHWPRCPRRPPKWRRKSRNRSAASSRGRSSGGGPRAPVRCLHRSPGEQITAGPRRGSAQR